MIGNDVIDLGDGESRAEGRHPRFDHRVFDGRERELIGASPQAERVRWLLWAAKESTYKALKKEDPRTVFAPSRFVVRLAGDGQPTVAVGNRRFRVDVVTGTGHVHAVARAAGDPPDAIVGAVGTLPPATAAGDATGSAAARRLAISTLARILGVAPEDLTIRRDGRIPTLWWRGRRSAADLSLSHHGGFVAFACMLPGRGGIR